MRPRPLTWSSRRSRAPTARGPACASALFKVNIADGILGHVSFNPNGDVTSNPVTIYMVVNGKSTTYKVIVPALSLVTAA